jgi:zinc transporter, ZIP family
MLTLKLIAFLTLPVLCLWIGVLVAFTMHLKEAVISSFQHFAGGIVFAAVAIELIPQIQHTHDPIFLFAGYTIGVIVMLYMEKYVHQSSMVTAVAVDLWVDGLLLAIGLTAGRQGGWILMIGLAAEALSLSLSTLPIFQKKQVTRQKILLIFLLFSACIWLGISTTAVLPLLPQSGLTFILGFGTSALLYLVAEELLVEAHKVADSPVISAFFFVGFAIPLALEQFLF